MKANDKDTLGLIVADLRAEAGEFATAKVRAEHSATIAVKLNAYADRVERVSNQIETGLDGLLANIHELARVALDAVMKAAAAKR